MELYCYKATIDRVIDGDTVDATINVGFDTTVKKTLRLLRVDTAELRSSDVQEKTLAYSAKDFVTEKVLGKRVTIKTIKHDSFGRWLAEVYYQENDKTLCLSDVLLAEGLAEEFRS